MGGKQPQTPTKTRAADKEPEPMADHHDNDHQHGTMDISGHEKTFQGFIRMSIWVAVVAIGILVFLGLVNS